MSDSTQSRSHATGVRAAALPRTLGEWADGGGEMGRRLRTMDWSAHPLGSPEGWPPTLRVAVGICMNSRFPMFVWWGDELFNFYNDAYIPILGKRHPDAFAKPARPTWHEIWPVIGPQADAVMQRGEPSWNERVLLVMERNGYVEDTYFTWSYSAIRDDAGSIVGLFCACTEETQRVRAETERDQLLKQVDSERERLASAFAQSPAFLAVLRGPDHVFEFANERYSQLVGNRSLVGKRVADAMPEVVEQGFVGLLDQVYSTGEQYVGRDARLLLKSRDPQMPMEEVYLDFVYQPMRSSDGQVIGILVHGVDITGRRRADEALRASQERYRSFIQLSSEGIWRFELDEPVNVSLPEDEQIQRFFKHARLAECNEATAQMYGFASPEEMVGRRLDEFHDPKSLDSIAFLRAFIQNGYRLQDAESVEPDRNGQMHTFLNSFVGLVESGHLIRAWGTQREVTDQRRAEAAAQEAQLRYRSIFEATRDGLILISPEGNIVEANPAACKMHGYTYEEFLGLEFKAIIHPDDQQVFQPFSSIAATGGEFRCEARDIRRDGTAFPVEMNGSSFFFNGKDHLLGVVRDITDRKRTANRLSRLYLVVAALSEVVSPEDVPRIAIEQGVAALGATAGSLALISPDGTMMEVVASIGYEPQNIEKWRQFPMDAPIAMTDAARLNVPVYLLTPQERFERYPALKTLVASEPTQSSACLPLSSGGKPIGAIGLSFPRPHGFNEDDKGFMLALARQTSQAMERTRLFAAERTARAEAERANEAKSEFLAVLSHELRTPLTPVLLTVSLLESNPDLPQEIRDDIATIRRNVELESQLISDLLDLTRITRNKLQLDQQDVDLHLILRSAIDICQREASARLIVELNAKQNTVRGDSTRLQQIFWNLINNAEKFTPPEGTVTVRTSDLPNQRVRVEVTDTGAGIDPAVLPRLFTAFEQGEIRSQRQQAGLGLGLAISKRLAEAHGGTIAVQSGGRGMGATFTVELPTIARAPISTTPPRSSAEGATTTRQLAVLLVEDHESTLAALTRLLKHLGHRVTGASTAAAAVSATKQDTFDLIISDLGLPDGSGLDVMRAIRGKFAGRAIALTGYGMEADIAASQDAGFDEHLTKPVDLEQLQQTIAKLFPVRPSPKSAK